MSKEFFGFKVGDYIRKNNFYLFGNQVGVEIRSLVYLKRPCKDNLCFIINKKHRVNPEHIQKITKEEKDALQKEYFLTQISETNPSPETNSSCIREDNGEPKQKLPQAAVKHILFRFRKKYPDKNFEAYKCGICEHYHVGKRKVEEQLNTTA